MLRCLAVVGAFSAAASLTGAAPVITTQPVATTITAPATLPLFVSVDPTSVAAGFSYQWYYEPTLGGTATAYGPAQYGATVGDTSYAAAATAPAPETGYYFVDVAQVNSTTESAMVYVTVNGATAAPTPAPSAAVGAFTQPLSQTVAVGATVVFATGTPETGVNYQWFHNGTALSDSALGATGTTVSGSTTARLVLSGTTAGWAGTYTVALNGTDGTTTSDAATLQVISTANPGHLTNLSSRAQVGTGSDVLITGFEVGGAGTVPLLVRASGPALAGYGLTGTLPDPELTLDDAAGTEIAANTGWANNAAVAAAAAQVGAFAFAAGSADSAVVATVSAGAYSAVVAGASQDTGVALLEVYDTRAAGTVTASSAHLSNLSTRVAVGTGFETLIIGFVVGGNTSETVLLRATGPELYPFGITDFLDEPELTIYDSTGAPVATNSGLQYDAQAAAVAATVGAFSWGTTATQDTALLLTLPPGVYSAQVAAANGTAGVALFELYEVP